MTGSAAIWSADEPAGGLLDLGLGAMLDRQAAAHADRPAVVVEDAARGRTTRWTYAELKDAADRLARGLIGWGVGHGDHVAVMAPNCAEWIALEYALAKVGAVLVTVNPGLREDEIGYILGQGRISHLLFAAEFRGYDLAAALGRLMPDLADATGGVRTGDALPDLRHLSLIGPGEAPFALPFDALAGLGADVTADALAERQAQVGPDDIAQIQYTSGTTGRPKGAMLRHRSILNNARQMGLRAGLTADDVLLSAMPLFHTAGCVCNALGMLNVGGCFVAMDAFEPALMLELWERHAATVINAVPTMYARMLDHPDFARRRTGSLRLANTGGTSIPPSLMRRLKDETGAEPMIVMGMTECSPVITQTSPEDDFETRISTAGTPLPGTEVRILDPETGAPVPFGAEGELCIRGYLLTAGYFDMPEKTAEAIDEDGWLHSGDLAVLDEGGHLRIVGRLKDMLIRGGENVYPVEIEDCLLTHPDVSQAQVVGAPDPDLGEEVYAFVLLRDGATATPEALRDHVRVRLARHKLPKWVEVVDGFPMTSNGKIRKVELREIAAVRVREGAA
ncbi:AMP-binding protein [Wenxinia marina]|uniref:3-methylmercaptopropionyl-CoA ligase n=1 Tax=Wenxinia marina DSM 24838 TaxID=1123501 RepID=A0A0D0QFP1_9RHOB|nr:AMP-binding protein [Wenxinia marina]KIQ69838.1 Acyl-CoA synthetase (AMP-forming)/AMP-acid ligase II [Wenxinia marina DSM 24838]GGL61623.1 AMP-binding protein [Wenxinia marina]